MSGDMYRVDEDTTVKFEKEDFTEEEWDWLNNISTGARIGGGNPRHVDEIILNVEKLSRIAFEYDILEDVANTVEIEVVRHFRESPETTMTTGEISDTLSRSKSSVSRALGSLVERGQLERVQQGVYRMRK